MSAQMEGTPQLHSQCDERASGSERARAVFLDRDGTLSEDVGYAREAAQYRLFPWTIPALRALRQSGYRVIVLTNQSGVARGYFPEALVHEVHRRFERELREHGAQWDAIYYCPHHPEGSVPIYRQVCACRKPATGLVERAAREFALDLRRCLFIGDKYTDILLAHRVGARGILVLTGHGREQWERVQKEGWRPPDHVAENLWEAVRWVLHHGDEAERSAAP
ncbi:MAG: HAD family hydrolase [Blastocatellia bacterium]|nr:HAD family hydrolase [Blastocatellia bacterium]MCS7156995.1 HAD family hydrolase [Blastocatellia bacterium]MCX7752196.1 HAD family hydrolase [Blastocatellia bacterium]MDW8167688.1 HAD family hydrolase [Acidobacteriota bacterium]MDW8256287.1 HAD family hydrolase [Acidobacteriota bacterium]